MNLTLPLAMRIVTVAGVLCASAVAQTPKMAQYEGDSAFVLANDKMSLSIMEKGVTLAEAHLVDDPKQINPFWNPMRFAREAGQPARPFSGSAGHFVCVDGFGQGSAEERAAGLPQHGEAHSLKFDLVSAAKKGNVAEMSFKVHLPLTMENFSRTFRMVDGENVVYMDSTLQSEVPFDRPISWGEHITLGSPFLAPDVTLTSYSGTQARVRPYAAASNTGQRRMVSDKDFTWPNAPLLAGGTTDLTAPPQNPHFTDHAAILFNPAEDLAWHATVQTEMKLLIGYVFRRTDYPWVQNWGSYGTPGRLARGMEISTQPYDEPRKEAVAKNGMFGAPTFRWLPAKASIQTSMLMFYTHTPDNFSKVTDVKFEGGKIRVKDDKGHTIELNASLSLLPPAR